MVISIGPWLWNCFQFYVYAKRSPLNSENLVSPKMSFFTSHRKNFFFLFLNKIAYHWVKSLYSCMYECIYSYVFVNVIVLAYNPCCCFWPYLYKPEGVSIRSHASVGWMWMNFWIVFFFHKYKCKLNFSIVITVFTSFVCVWVWVYLTESVIIYNSIHL